MPAVIGPWAAKSTVANRISHGTSAANTRSGVRSSSSAPIKPPASEGGTKSSIQRRIGARSFRKAAMAASAPGQSARVLVALAMIGARPSQSSAGNETSVPPPASELIAPATAPAAKSTATSSPVSGRSSRAHLDHARRWIANHR